MLRRLLFICAANRHRVSSEFNQVTDMCADGVRCLESAIIGPVAPKVFPRRELPLHHHGPIYVRLFFPPPTIVLVWSGHIESICVVMTYSRVWTNRVKLPILLVVNWTEKMNTSLPQFAPENLVSWDRFSRPVPRQPPHSTHSGWIWCSLTGFVPLSAAASIYLFTPPTATGPVPSFIRSRTTCLPMAFTADSLNYWIIICVGCILP